MVGRWLAGLSVGVGGVRMGGGRKNNKIEGVRLPWDNENYLVDEERGPMSPSRFGA